jgi:uncharacterized protein (DUF983 family)
MKDDKWYALIFCVLTTVTLAVVEVLVFTPTWVTMVVALVAVIVYACAMLAMIYHASR